MHRILPILLSLCAPAFAADLEVRVTDLRSTDGQLLVAVCPQADFASDRCTLTGSAPASDGAVTIRGIPPGTYAVQAVHDENGNGTLDLRFRVQPLEGMGFSRDAPIRRGPPRFGDAALAIRGDGTISLAMRYFQ